MTRTAIFFCIILALRVECCCGESAFKQLKKIDLPSLSEFKEDRFDQPRGTILQWIQEIEIALLTHRYSCSVRSETISEFAESSGKKALLGWSHSFLRARNPASNQERIVSIYQRLLDNFSIAENTGTAFDNRRQIDILRNRGSCLVSRRTPLLLRIDEQLSESEVAWSDQVKELRMLGLFDPIAAATVSPQQTALGGAMDFSRHNFRSHAIRSVVSADPFTHVQLVLKGSAGQFQVASFRNRLPVQVAHFRPYGEHPSKEDCESVVRAEWGVAPGSGKQELPKLIFGVGQRLGLLAELQATVDWRFGDEVDASLFDEDTLGQVSTDPDSNFDIPLLLR